MGAVKKKMPVTYWTFMTGTLALCGIPPLSGFYSWDGILSQALTMAARARYGLFTLGVIVAGLTTFYMFRLCFVVFGGAARSEAPEHAHESPNVMVWPLRILAVFSVIGGVIGIESLFANYFEPGGSRRDELLGDRLLEPFSASPLAAFLGLFAVMIGFGAAFAIYRNRMADPLPEKLVFLSRALRNKFYFDELYENILIPCTQGLLSRVADALDRWIISGFVVRGVSGTTEFVGRALRMVQTGSLQTYAFLLVTGVAVVLYFILVR